MIHIRFSFLAAALVMVLLGYAVPFTILVISVTLHELAHTFTAKSFGGCVDGLNLTAMGEVAVIRRLERMSIGQRLLTLLAGPFANASIVLLSNGLVYVFTACRLPSLWAEAARQVSDYNLLLFCFNLLPFFPLDGGRLLQMILGNRFGILRANRFIIRVSRFAGRLMMLLGIVQTILYPYNISLLCVGLYLNHRNNGISLPLTFECFKILLEKPEILKERGCLPIKHLAVSSGYPLQRVMDCLGWDTMTCVLVDGEKNQMLTELSLTRYAVLRGLTGTVGEAYEAVNETCLHAP